jgi:anti-sigma factor RsiW
MISNALKCQELVELITDYLEGALSSTERSRFEAHLAVCTDCRAYLGQMRQTLHLLGTLPQEAISSEAQQALLAAFQGWKTSSNTPPLARQERLLQAVRRILRWPRR